MNDVEAILAIILAVGIWFGGAYASSVDITNNCKTDGKVALFNGATIKCSVVKK